VNKLSEKPFRKKDKSDNRTFELIKWSYYVGVFNDNERSDLKDFNSKRNQIIHGHSKWYIEKKTIENHL